MTIGANRLFDFASQVRGRSATTPAEFFYIVFPEVMAPGAVSSAESFETPAGTDLLIELDSTGHVVRLCLDFPGARTANQDGTFDRLNWRDIAAFLAKCDMQTRELVMLFGPERCVYSARRFVAISGRQPVIITVSLDSDKQVCTCGMAVSLDASSAAPPGHDELGNT